MDCTIKLPLFCPSNLAVNLYILQEARAAIIKGKSSNDRLTGTSAKDTLEGLLGDDTLDGGLGIDYLAGGQGNDVYYVDLLS